jgi:hypothetical protein
VNHFNQVRHEVAHTTGTLKACNDTARGERSVTRGMRDCARIAAEMIELFGFNRYKPGALGDSRQSAMLWAEIIAMMWETKRKTTIPKGGNEDDF